MAPVILGALFALCILSPVAAAPRIVADIAPVHAIAARIVEGVGTPTLLLPPDASPHGYSMTPSDARALEGAEMVIWIGSALTPWLEKPVETLASEAETLELAAIEETYRLGWREGALFEDHQDHDDHDADHDDHAHGDHHDAHDHGEVDPHMWLDPHNAAIWADVIAARLAARDPENADLYRENAVRLKAELGKLETELAETLAPLRGKPFFVYHDAFHYFEHRFDIEAVGALSLGDAAAPGPRRVRAIRDAVEESGAVCFFVEPQQPSKLVESVIDIRIGVLDPFGASLEPGPMLYPMLLRNLAAGLADCLSDYP